MKVAEFMFSNIFFAGLLMTLMIGFILQKIKRKIQKSYSVRKFRKWWHIGAIRRAKEVKRNYSHLHA